MENYNKQYFFWCDAVRFVAIMLVLLNHSLEFIIPLNTASQYLSYTPPLQYFSTFIFLIGRMGVPLFLFLSGYLILRKEITTKEEIILFYKKNLLSMIFTMEIWIIFIFTFLHYIKGFNSYVEIPLSMLFLQQVPYMQMWYVPFIVGVYIGIPFLSCIIKNIPKSILTFFYCILLVFCMILPTIGIFYNMKDPYLLKNCTYGIGYNSYSIIYLCTGYFLGTEKINFVKKIPNFAVIILSSFFFCINWKLQMSAFELGYNAKFGYDQICGFLSSVFLFILLFRIFNKEYNFKWFWINKIITTIATMSFAAFFLHAPIQDILRMFIYVPSKATLVFINFIASAIITNMILFILFQIKPLRKIMFNKR